MAGVLASAKTSQDVAIEAFTLSVAGNQLVQDTRIELNQGADTASSAPTAAARATSSRSRSEVRLQGHIDCFLLHEERLAQTDRR